MYETKKYGGKPLRIRDVIRREYPWLSERLEINNSINQLKQMLCISDSIHTTFANEVSEEIVSTIFDYYGLLDGIN
jgi:hypothetical protein